MIDVTREDMLKAFKAAGISKGDIVLVFSNLGRLGRVKDAKSKQESLNTYLNALTESVGAQDGTIVVPTFTYSFAHGKAYDHEKSPSELCMFGEFVRNQKDSVRCLHPHFSFAALGKNKNLICDNVSRSAFGYESVFDRLYKKSAKILFLGTNITEGLTFFLYIEHMVGVSHCYHKAYFTPVYKDGQLVKGPFFSFVRHLQPGFQADLSSFERDLKKEDLVKESDLGSGKIQLVYSREAFDSGYKKLQENPCYFFNKEFYITE
ncbi:MAG: AAC(3) family N-acetyltransferase [Candidatus Omnitrophota bacterium]|jgi:aminoglycoside 3-N-acetyltransferase